MASRLKMIEYSAQTDITTLAAATIKYLTGNTNIYIPESTLVFKSVLLELFVAGDNTTTASLTTPTIGFKLGSAAMNWIVLPNPNANAAQHESWQLARDMTTYFTSNWSGNAMAWNVGWSGGTIATANIGAKILITYQYEDSISNTRIKTIRIPIESTRSILTTSYQTVGGAAAIPALTNFGNFGLTPYLPETGITIRQIYLDLQFNDACNSTGNFSGATLINNIQFTFWRNAATLNSSRWGRAFQNLTSFILTGATSIQMISSPVTSRFTTTGGLIVCTYEYDHSGSTAIYNSLMVGGVDTSGWIGGTGVTYMGAWSKNMYIEEPAPIKLKESAVALYLIDSGGVGLQIAVTGSTTGQTVLTTYSMVVGSVQAGQYSLFHRIDASGQNGSAGINLTRGKNLYQINFGSNTPQVGWNLSGILYLNYISGKHINGDGAHMKTCFQLVSSGMTVTRVQGATAVACPIPETNYYQGGFLTYIACTPAMASATDFAYSLMAQLNPGEGENFGWDLLYNGQGREGARNALQTLYGAARSNFTRWNGDPDPNRLNLISARQYRLDSGPTNFAYYGYYYTYGSITFTVSGTCNGYSGDGSGIPVDIYRVVNSTVDEPILNVTTTAGGIFTAQWTDNTDTLYAAARQDDTHVGRSRNGTAT